jgi:hypothetical protein
VVRQDHSFIFNFNFMIKKITFCFIILFAAYYVIVLLNPNISAPQQQWRENVVKAEKYVYDKSDTIEDVILGSSLARLMVMDSLPHFYNLAFAGQGILDGIEILNRKEKLPKNIFIEMNTVFTELDKTFINDLFDPLSFSIKKYCISLRSDKQPLGFLYPAIQAAAHKGKNKAAAKAQVVSQTTDDNDLFNEMMKMQIEYYTWTPDSNFVTRQFLLLTSYVNGLKSKGANIVFFEMPLNPKLVQLPLARLMRDKFYSYFPENSNNYIKMPDCSNYVTSDGFHLKEDEAKIYTSYFKTGAKKYRL